MALTVWDVFQGGDALANKVNQILVSMFDAFVVHFKREMDQIDAKFPNANRQWRRIVEEMLQEFEARERKDYLNLMKRARVKMGRTFLRQEDALDAVKQAFWKKMFNVNLNKYKKVYHDALIEALNLCHQSVLGFRGLIRSYKMKLLGWHSSDVWFDKRMVPQTKDDILDEDEREQLTWAADEMIKFSLNKYFLLEMEARSEVTLKMLYKNTRQRLLKIRSIEKSKSGDEQTAMLQNEWSEFNNEANKMERAIQKYIIQ